MRERENERMSDWATGRRREVGERERERDRDRETETETEMGRGGEMMAHLLVPSYAFMIQATSFSRFSFLLFCSYWNVC